MKGVAQLDDLLGHQRRARDRLDDGQLAAFDAARDFDFAFAGQQRHRAHFPQVHADRVVGLVEGAWREIELELLRPFSRAVDRLVVPHVLLVGVDDFDACAAESVEQVIEFVGRGDLGGQEFIHLVVKQVTFLLTDVDELSYLVVLFFDRHLFSLVLRQLLDLVQQIFLLPPERVNFRTVLSGSHFLKAIDLALYGSAFPLETQPLQRVTAVARRRRRS